MTAEQWRPVGSFPAYEVSNLGRVRSFARNRPMRGRQADGSRLLSPVPQPSGHLTVSLFRDGVARSRFVHRLVLEAFVGPCPDGLEACHGPDPDPTNNCLRNLRWDTRAENSADRVRQGTAQTSEHRRLVGLKHAARGDKHGSRTRPDAIVRGERRKSAKLTDAKVRLCRFLRVVHGAMYPDLCDWFGLSKAAMCDLLLGRTWSHVPMVGGDNSASFETVCLQIKRREYARAEGEIALVSEEVWSV